jgi:hypothetical protein
MLQLKTTRGIIHLNLFLMQADHFEELRRLIWRHVRGKRRQDGRAELLREEQNQAIQIGCPRKPISTERSDGDR